MNGFTLRSLDSKCCSEHKVWCGHGAVQHSDGACEPARGNVLIPFSVALKGTCTAGSVNVGRMFSLWLSKQSLVFPILLYQSPHRGLNHPVVLN